MAKNILGIDDHYLRYPKDEWGWTDLNNPDMVNPWIDINKIINPKKVIEIGMFAGHASLIMMTVFKNLEYLVSYDPDPISRINAKQIKKYWPMHYHEPKPIWDDWKKFEDDEIDFIFVDGNHNKISVTRDLEACMKIRPNYLVLDNIEQPDVRRIAKLKFGLFGKRHDPKYYFYTNEKWSSTTEEWCVSPGIMGLFRMKGTYDDDM